MAMWRKVSFAMAMISVLIYSGSAYGETMLMETDNELLRIELRTDKAVLLPEESIRFTISFLDAMTAMELEHVNYAFGAMDNEGNVIASTLEQHTHGGVDIQSVTFPEAGSYTITIFVEGTGLNRPYDTKYSSTGTTMVTVGEAVMEEVTEPPEAMESMTVTYEESIFDVPVSITDGTVKTLEVDTDFVSVIILLEKPSEDAELVISLPRELLDSRTNGEDDDFIVIVDGEEVSYEELETSDTERKLLIPVTAGSEEVEIIGTHVVPEFPLVTMLVMGAVVASVVALTRLNRQVIGKV